MFNIKINIYQIRHEKNMSLRELSKISGVSFQAINQIENHKNSPSLDTLYLIAKALNVKMSDLYDCDIK